MTAPGLLNGVDISSFNGSPQNGWPQAAGKIAWVAVKLTEASRNPDGSVTAYVNPDAAADWAYAARHKLGRIAYLYGHPAAPVMATVNVFRAELTTLGFGDGDGLMLDLETADGLTPAEVDTWAAEVMAEIEKRLSRTPLLYTYLDFAREGNCASLGRYPLWISDPSSPRGRPQVPAPWKDWAIHQYSTAEPIDRDVAEYPTLAAMQRALGKHEPPEDAPMKMMSAVLLEDTAIVPPDSKPLALRWRAEPGQPSKLNGQGDGMDPGAGAVISSVNVRVAEGSSLRFAVAELAKDGKPGREVNAEFRDAGGWTQFTAPFPAAEGSVYLITVTNFGAHAARISEGSWELYR